VPIKSTLIVYLCIGEGTKHPGQGFLLWHPRVELKVHNRNPWQRPLHWGENWGKCVWNRVNNPKKSPAARDLSWHETTFHPRLFTTHPCTYYVKQSTLQIHYKAYLRLSSSQVLPQCFVTIFCFRALLVWRKKLIVKSIFHYIEKILTLLTPDESKNNNKPKSQSFEGVREHGLHLFEQTTHKVLHVTPYGWAICNPPLPTLYNPGSKCTSLHCTQELDNSGTKV